MAGHGVHETDAAASAACAFKDTLEKVVHANCIGMRTSEANAQHSVVPTLGHRTHQTLWVKNVHCMHTVHNARCNRRAIVVMLMEIISSSFAQRNITERLVRALCNCIVPVVVVT